MLKKDEHFRVPAPFIADEAKTYANPVIRDFADPSVVYCPESGYYYASRSCFDPTGIAVCRGRTLPELFDEQKIVFLTGPQVGLYKGCWASEIHHIGGKWYIYSAATCSPTEEWPERKMRTFVLASRTDDPFEGFDFAGILSDDAAIDATVFQDHKRNKLYLCYSRCIDIDRQSLMMCEMASPTQLKGEPLRIARASYDWELYAPYDGIQRINEGPFFIEHEDRTFCVFSANGCWIDEYCLGIMELVGDDPMNQSAWVKDDVPWLFMKNGVYAPGHASFFYSPDGTELYISYHAVTAHNPNNQPVPRHLCVQKIYFDQTGFPHVGEPVPFGQRLPLPVGDPGASRKG